MNGEWDLPQFACPRATVTPGGMRPSGRLVAPRRMQETRDTTS